MKDRHHKTAVCEAYSFSLVGAIALGIGVMIGSHFPS